MPVKPTRKVTITLYGSTGADFKDALHRLADDKNIATLVPTKAPTMIETEEVFGSLEIQKVIGSMGF